jgi:hypothetical protein
MRCWWLLVLASCHAQPGTQVMMQFDRAKGFYSAPFPSNDLLRADGSIDLDSFPNPNQIDLINQGLALLKSDKQGFPRSSGILMQLTDAIDASRLPDVAASISDGAPIYLTAIDSSSPDYLRKSPVEIAFMSDGGSLGAKNMLSLLPLQGIPLRASTTYAAVVTKRVSDAKGRPLDVAPEISQLLNHDRPSALPESAFADYSRALTALGDAAKEVAGLAVFTTGDPSAATKTVRDDMLARPLPSVNAPPALSDVFDGYCVYATTIDMPDYQAGDPPFSSAGGAWQFDAAGKPMLQRMDRSNIVITIPRRPMPATGYPVVVFVRTGGGGDRPIVDRGVQATNGGPPIAPGTGPARWFAEAGFAGVTVDGPLGGLRNVTHGDEQYLVFNVFNAAALRDNIRESAVELMLLAHIVQALRFDASDCMGSASAAVQLDVDHLALMGHSTGAWIAQLVLAYEPMYRAAILSGAGASWIENVMYKKKPLDVRPLAEILLDYNMDQRSLSDNDPALSFVQWAAEPSDPQVYDARVIREPADGASARHVLMLQGIVDHYIMPQIANATSLSLGLDLAGTPLDSASAELMTQTPLAAVLRYSGRGQIALPASGNQGGVTAVVVQHPADGIEDGHEVVFQTEAPKHQYRCFLQSWLAGTPVVVTDGAADADCP